MHSRVCTCKYATDRDRLCTNTRKNGDFPRLHSVTEIRKFTEIEATRYARSDFIERKTAKYAENATDTIDFDFN